MKRSLLIVLLVALVTTLGALAFPVMAQEDHNPPPEQHDPPPPPPEEHNPPPPPEEHNPPPPPEEHNPPPPPVEPPSAPVEAPPAPPAVEPPPAAPEPPPAPPAAEPPPPPTIADIVVSSASGNPPQFVTLLAAVQAADPSILAALADRNGRLTVFAPTDEAFAFTLGNLGIAAGDLLANRPLLDRILQYHVVPGVFSAGDLAAVAGRTDHRLPTLTNATLEFTHNNGLRVNNIPIIAADIQAVNGVIHVIPEVLIPPVAEPKTIADIVVASTTATPPQFTVLLAAVQAADPSILAALADENGSLTVFAPTDAAFTALLEALGVSAGELLGNTELLNTVLRYHVLAGEFASGDLIGVAQSDNPTKTTLQGDDVRFRLEGSTLFVNDSQVIQADIQAVNGIIHIIDAVLMPPMEQTIAEIVVASTTATPPQFTVLLAAVQAADPSILAALADENGSLTVFAPTDAAFTALLEALGVSAGELLGNTELLNTVLRYHVLAGEFASGDLIGVAQSDNNALTTLLGEPVHFRLEDGSLFVNDSQVIQADILASNGIIHVIDAVLMPPMEQTIAEIVVESTTATPPQFTVLLAALQAADPSILQALADENGSLTVFAPTDAAFTALLEALGVSAGELLGNTDLLNTVLRYHVLAGEFASGDLIGVAQSDNNALTTLLGQSVHFRLEDGSLFVNDSRVIQADILASNGIIHVIDAVLLPPTDEPPPPVSEVPTIAEIVVASTQGSPAEFTVLLAALQAADPSLLAAVADPDANLTVFAPTDAAFTALLGNLGVSAGELLANTELLNTVLRYHVVVNTFEASDLISRGASSDNNLYTLLLKPVALTLDGGSLVVNDSTVIAADIMARNGVVHVIDEVLLPPTAPTVADAVIAAAGADAAQFTILLQAVLNADPAILATLSSPDANLTVFAPTDAAFAALLSELGVSAEELLGNRELLTTVLSYHVVVNQFPSDDLTRRAADGGTLTTLLLQPVTLTLDGGTLRVNQSNVVQADLRTANGIIHVIDAVLLPSS